MVADDCAGMFTTLPSAGLGRLVGTFQGSLTRLVISAPPLVVTDGFVDVETSAPKR